MFFYRINHTGDIKVPISFNKVNNIFRIFSIEQCEKAMNMHKESRTVSLSP